MAVTKLILRQLVGVRLARLSMIGRAGNNAKAIYSVAGSGTPGPVRYFSCILDAETYFVAQVGRCQSGDIDGTTLLRARMRNRSAWGSNVNPIAANPA